jgi:hypothetical protein
MKKLLYLIAIFIYSLNLNSQSILNLDSNNGFKHLKFGMSLSQIKHLKLNKEYTKSYESVKYYDYTGNDLNYIDGIQIDKIIVSFYKNKLYGIQLVFGDIFKEFTDSQTEIVIDALKSSFGYNYTNCLDSINMINCLIWDGKKVRCEFIRFNESEKDGTRNPNFNYISGYILFQYKSLVNERKRESFK